MIFLYPETRCTIEIMALAMVLGCLLPVWIVFGQGRWFVRATIAVVAISALLPIHAYQPAVWFVVTTMTSVALLIPLRVWLERKSTPPLNAESEPRQPARWVQAVTLVACLVIAFLCLNRIVGHVPAMGWREMSFVFISIFFFVLLIACSFNERKRTGVVGKPDINDNVKRYPGLKFSVMDTLLATGVIAFAASLATYAFRQDPIFNHDGFLWLVLMITLMTVFVTVITLVRNLPIRIFVFVLLLALISLSEYKLGFAQKWCSETFAYGGFRAGDGERAIAITVRGFAIVLAMFAWIAAATNWFFLVRRSGSPPQRSTKIARVGAIVLGLLTLSCLIPIYIKMAVPVPPRAFTSSLAERTNYQKVAAQVAKVEQTNLGQATAGQRNRDVQQWLAELDLMLTKPIAVFYDNEAAPNLANELDRFRLNARRSDQLARTAAAEERYDETIESAMRCVRIGAGLGRGGYLVHVLTGIAIERIGYEHLGRIRKEISLSVIPVLLSELTALEQSRESIASIQAAADLEMERTLGWRYRLSMVAFELSAARPEHCHTLVSPTIEATEEAILRRDAALQLLIAELAIHWFESTKGHRPNTLAELVPDFLAALPIDPYTGEPLIYRSNETGMTLYSVGINRTDNGGHFGSTANLYQEGFDYDLETLWRPTIKSPL